MGMTAEILAIGQFSKDIVDILSYPPDSYKDTPEGDIICTSVAWMPTSSTSSSLAESFGIDPWKFEEHVFVPIYVDYKILEELEGCTDNENLRIIVKKLIEKNFLFIYRPNG